MISGGQNAFFASQKISTTINQPLLADTDYDDDHDAQNNYYGDNSAHCCSDDRPYVATVPTITL